MKNLVRSVIWVALCLLAAEGWAVKPGDRLATVYEEKGEPQGRLQSGRSLILKYAGETITLRDGVVVAVKPANRPRPVSQPQVAQPAAAESEAAEAAWGTDFAAARVAAREQDRRLLLFFTGSDWCGWCMRLEREVLGTPEFAAYAAEHLVLVKLDYPRAVRQTQAVVAQNRRLARQYGIRGYPTLVVLDPQGEEVGRLGYEPGGPAPFLERLNTL